MDTAGEENKDDIFFTMGAFEDFFIGFAKEKLNDTSPKSTYESSQFGKSIFLVCVGIVVEGSEIFYQVFQIEVIVFLCHKNSISQGRRGREGGREGEGKGKGQRGGEERGGGGGGGGGGGESRKVILNLYWITLLTPLLHVPFHVLREQWLSLYLLPCRFSRSTRF